MGQFITDFYKQKRIKTKPDSIVNRFNPNAMKQLTLFILVFVFSAMLSSAQITPEHTYTGVSAAYIHLPVAGYKYYVMDVANKQCRLYNNDHSLWKTINLSIPAGYYLCDIQYVTEDLFNTDNLIEMLYVSCNYNTTLKYYTYDTRIVNENGTLLLSMPYAGYSYVYPAETGSKLFMWIYDFSVFPETVNTMVYPIPGNLKPLTTGSPDELKSSLRSAYPNPATNEVTIPYSLPSNVKQAELKLYSMNGRLVKSFTIDHTFNSLLVKTSELPAGLYVYRIESNTFKSESYKLVVSK